MSKRNRRAGHNWERECVEILSEFFPHIVTSRSESRSRDDQKVDLINKDEYENGRLPIQIQCKTTVNSVNYSKLLDEMPKGDNVVLHKRTVKSEKGKFVTKGKYAIMEIDLFLKLLKDWKLK